MPRKTFTSTTSKIEEKIKEFQEKKNTGRLTIYFRCGNVDRVETSVSESMSDDT